MILDTNALSALAEGEAALEPILNKTAEIAVPIIVLGEFGYGISRSRHRLLYERWLTEYLPAFRVLDVNEGTTVPYIEIRTELRDAGTPIPANDAWIAALCRQHSLPILTRDRHFDLVRGIRRLGW